MKNADQAFVQADTARIAVEGSPQILIACTVTNQASEAPHAVPLAAAVIANTGKRPRPLLSDAGYWSETNAIALAAQQIDPFLATEKMRHGEPPPPPPRGRIPAALGLKARMRRKLQTT